MKKLMKHVVITILVESLIFGAVFAAINWQEIDGKVGLFKAETEERTTPSAAEQPDDWEELTFAIGDTKLKLPCTLGEFKERTGFDFWAYAVFPRDEVIFTDGYSVLQLKINTNTEKVSEAADERDWVSYVGDDIVYGIQISSGDTVHDFKSECTAFIAPGGIRFGDTRETVEKRLGKLSCVQEIGFIYGYDDIGKQTTKSGHRFDIQFDNDNKVIFMRFANNFAWVDRR
ncbi:MAG: hypothetical protein LBJ12_06105 [Oscillospiraceae bacterium]|jgi:hypothetical protein|nr:hypothetical protein [Oscillospiraceae bacterium]